MERVKAEAARRIRRFSTGRHTAVATAMATLLAAVAFAGSSTVAGAVSGTVNLYSSTDWTVPAGVHSIEVTLTGGGGGYGGTNCSLFTPGSGGSGAMVAYTMPVTPGDTLFFGVGGAGENGSGHDAYGGGGSPGYGWGGTGGKGSGCGAASGGGGAASYMKLGTGAGSGAVVAVAGGGGGGGGAGVGLVAGSGDGGDGGAGGRPGWASASGGIGGGTGYSTVSGQSAVGATASGGAGGGGGSGYQGGWAGGRSGDDGGGGGGGGGTNYLDTSVAQQVGDFGVAGNPEGDGMAIIQYSSKDATITSATATPLTSVFGQSVDIAVTVAAPGASTIPAGTVELTGAGATLASAVPVAADGTAHIPVANLPVGTTTVTAAFTPSQPDDFTTSSGSVDVTVTKGATTLTLTDADPTTNAGTAATFRARVQPVAPAAGTPSGTVQFSADGSALGAPVALDASGQASLVTTALGIGSHQITATYSGSGSFTTSSGGPVTHRVIPGSTSLEVFSSKNPTVVGEATTFTAALGGASGSPIPSGDVRFTADGVILCTVSLSSTGQATLSGSGLSVGSHQIIATYLGDSTHSGSTSATITQRVDKGDVVVVVSPPSAPATVGDSVVLDAHLAVVAPAMGTPSGTVQFSVGGAPLGAPVPISGGLASIRTTALPVGANNITAHYSGDRNFNDAISSPVGFAIDAKPTTTGVVASKASTVPGESLNLSVTVAGTGPDFPSGPVILSVDGAYFDTVVLGPTGRATTSTSSLAVGPHQIVASYVGDGNFAASASDPLGHEVTKGLAKVTVSPQTGTATVGDPVDLVAAVAPEDPAQGRPSGTIQFFVDGAPLGDPMPIVSGGAALTTDVLGAGTHQITAVSSGDSLFEAGTSRPVVYVIGDPPVTTVPPTTTVPPATTVPPPSTSKPPTVPNIVINNNNGVPDRPSTQSWSSDDTGTTARPSTSATTHGTLPATGSNLVPLGSLAALLVASGAGLVLLRRRSARLG